jgi:hypothetical protein
VACSPALLRNKLPDWPVGYRGASIAAAQSAGSVHSP